MYQEAESASKTRHIMSEHSVNSPLWSLDFHTMQGRKSENQDSLLITTCLPHLSSLSSRCQAQLAIESPLLVLMADGVSACQFPKKASQLVIDTVAYHLTLFLKTLILEQQLESEQERQISSNMFDDDKVAILIKKAVNKANDLLYFPQAYQRVPPLLSTLSGLLCIGDRIHLFHTGDSRIYRMDIDSMAVLSQDHRIHHGQDKGALSAAIGADMYVELQQSVFTLHQEECLALMTDGVYEAISPAELQFELCTATKAFSQPIRTTDQTHSWHISQNLCEQAFSEGSHDNLTMVILGMNAQALQTQAKFEVDNTVGQGVDNDSTTDNSVNPNIDINTDINTYDINRYQLPKGLVIGERIDCFTVVDIIAYTARSQVYLVEDEDHHKFVLKSPSLDTIADGHYLREFLKERKIGLSLSKHRRAGELSYNQADPHVQLNTDIHTGMSTHKRKGSVLNTSGLLRYYPVPASSTYLYHLTEYIEGESLRVFMDRNAPCDVWQTYDLLTKIGMAVRVMHRNYLLHQDIKPENVLLTKSGAVKLIDFGSAGSSILKDSTRPPNGDLHYAAPEYYTDAPKGVHSDLFSIAVIGYELLTGELPFSSQTLMSPQHILTVPTPLLRQYRVPANTQQALMRALHANTHARYQAIGEFLQDFNPDNTTSISDPEPLIVRYPLLVWHSICFIQLVIILSLLAYFV